MRGSRVQLSVTRRTRSAHIRRGTSRDAEAIYSLIRDHQVEGHLLPRTIDDIRRRAARFVVAETGGQLQACAELAPLTAAGRPWDT